MREEERQTCLRSLEESLWQEGFCRVAGVDEAGRGPLAGPVVAAACVLPAEAMFWGLDDSKKLSESQRASLFEQIVSTPGVDYGVGVVEADVIDKINILQATLLAMRTALQQLKTSIDFVLVDGTHLPQTSLPARAVIKGDQKSRVMAAASILAKHTRDKLMDQHHKTWPHYGFDRHRGYGTAAHKQAIEQQGPCSIHRMSFSPLRGIHES